MFASAAPEFSATQRTINFAANSPTPGKAHVLAESEHVLFDGPRWISWRRRRSACSDRGPIRICARPGVRRPHCCRRPTMHSASSIRFPRTAPTSTTAASAPLNPNVIYNTGADITLTPSLVATTRFGYFYQDLQDRGLPVGNPVHLPRHQLLLQHDECAGAGGHQGVERNRAAVAVREFDGLEQHRRQFGHRVRQVEALQLQPGPGVFQEGPGNAQPQVRILVQPRHQRRDQRLQHVRCVRGVQHSVCSADHQRHRPLQVDHRPEPDRTTDRRAAPRTAPAARVCGAR